jgi:hypothetical protein
MSLTLALAAAGAASAGYVLGRCQPFSRARAWANWQAVGRRPTGLRYAAVYVLLSAENIAWLASHPVRGWQAWKRRNDPPPGRSPAVEIRRVRRAPAPAFDPQWADHRHTPTTTSDAGEDQPR